LPIGFDPKESFALLQAALFLLFGILGMTKWRGGDNQRIIFKESRKGDREGGFLGSIHRSTVVCKVNFEKKQQILSKSRRKCLENLDEFFRGGGYIEIEFSIPLFI
jgi:hypothetical protein